ncbi:RHS repeat-associated core domain-containing protein [Neptunitalea lumnitzerae]|uniref:RHS repeat-associated core domain-containing protein n=1 Tax=Neptunitalea lumnitzerae TaxID=2965509 RepID=A0ABQ5MKB2_9FLAO|nr:RHS repeat-associated core domain-containing protein [Neptunitalea sp. Y10]GLB49851.1 hypothetical protein Y10_22190 [Neptunitalea sp. Y10]
MLITNNYYYGARYYNPKTSIWLSVDPLADDYPGWSPYNYCMQNPVMLTDPTGMGVFNPVYGSDGSYRGDTIEGYTGEILIFDGTTNNSKGYVIGNTARHYYYSTGKYLSSNNIYKSLIAKYKSYVPKAWLPFVR